jgi:hypothetical protein
MRTVLSIAVLTAAVLIGLGPVPAGAATGTWTVSPGAVSGTGTSGIPARVHLNDATTGVSIRCRGNQNLNVRFKRGSGLTNPIGHVIGFGECTAPRGAAPLSIVSPTVRAVSYDASTGVTTGRITGIQMFLSWHGCSATVDGTTASQGTVLHFTYTNGTGALSIFTAPGNLHFFNVGASCSGVLNIHDGDRATFHGRYTFSPVQMITSP